MPSDNYKYLNLMELVSWLADDDKNVDACKNAFNLLLDTLIKNNFHPIVTDCDDEDIKNHYSFYIKELPGWLFGIWFDEYKEPGCLLSLFFAQYEDTAFKTTPTRAKMKTILAFNVSEDNPGISLSGKDEMLNILNFILKESYLAFYRDIMGTDFNYEYVSRRKAKKLFHSWCKEQKQKENLKRLI